MVFVEAVQARNGASTRRDRARLRTLSRVASRSSIVMNRRLGPLYDWITGSDPLLRTFHRQVELGRPPGEDEWNAQREAAESAVLPYCYQDISFAALSPDGRGLNYYGPYIVTLDPKLIGHRTSLFERNPFYFLRMHGVVAGTLPPVGRRSRWRQRRCLALAKLAGAALANRSARLSMPATGGPNSPVNRLLPAESSVVSHEVFEHQHNQTQRVADTPSVFMQRLTSTSQCSTIHKYKPLSHVSLSKQDSPSPYDAT